MLRESRTSKWVLFWIAFIALAAQLPSVYVFYRILKIQDAIAHYDDILASEVAESTDVEFITRLKKEAGFKQDVQILVGPYKRLYGDSFKYRLEQHLVFVEPSQTTKETFLILFDKTFYNELNHEQRKGVLAHEMWHVFSLAKKLMKPRVNEERDADDYAIRYVSVKIMLEFCEQYEGDDFMRKIRIENLERHRLAIKSSNTG